LRPLEGEKKSERDKKTVRKKGKKNEKKNSLKNIEFDYNAEPMWELAARLSAQVPQEEWAKLPTDLARNFDHYQQQDHS
jgi:hypothetical protein